MYLWALCKLRIRIVLVRWYFHVEIEKCAVLKLPDICSEEFEWKIANIFAGFWKSAQYCHWAILPCSAFSFRRVDRWNRKSQIFPKHGRILKFKHQQCYKLIKTFLETEDEGGLGFELWPQFGNFARFFCAFALNNSIAHNMFFLPGNLEKEKNKCQKCEKLSTKSRSKIFKEHFPCNGSIFLDMDTFTC